MKVHIGTDTQGLAHSLVTTGAAQSDYNELPNLIHGEEDEIHAGSAYRSDSDRRCFQEVKVRYRVNRRGHRNRPLSDRVKVINGEYSRRRARVEHPFHVVKRLWGFGRVRYRGLAKNTTRAYAAFALANLYLARKRLARSGRSVGASDAERRVGGRNRGRESMSGREWGRTRRFAPFNRPGRACSEVPQGVRRYLRGRQHQPNVVRAYFHEKHVRYATA